MTFTGTIPHSQIREYYACCDLFTTASRSEVNSISMLEAMAMGLAWSSTRGRGEPRSGAEGINGLLFRTAEEFHRILQHFKRTPAALRELQASTVESVRFAGQEDLARRVEAVYLKHLALTR